MPKNAPKTNSKPLKPAGRKTISRLARTEKGTETIRVQVPKGMSRSHVSVLVNQELAQPVHGFFEFLRERAIVGLAVGFVVATQVQGVVKQLVASFLDPLSKLLFGSKLSNQTLTLHLHGRTADFEWGQFVYVLVNFFVVVITIYALIKLFKLDKLDKPKDKDKDKDKDKPKDAKADTAKASTRKK